ncbi:MAG: DNA-binding response regulator [Legionellales bacterium]|nr:DNA-binding response regulator [Legionellales bacterium]
MRVLVVEDDEILGEAIQAGLRKDGYAVDWLKDGQIADQVLKSEEFDAVVLDLGLPKLHGIRVLENIRLRGSKVPVLILTARDAIEDRIKGLDMGADDYMTKPYDLNEVGARLRALQRRSVDRASPEIHYKDIIIDPIAHEVKFEGLSINLPRREFALLQKLIENQGKALSRDQLTQSLYNWDEDVDSNALEVHIHNLRKKFGSKLIRTIRGVGYMVEKEKPKDD